MNATVALLFAALMIHGVRPGPMLIAEHPEVFWGIVASMYIGNVMLLILNLPLIGIWVKVLKIPYRIIFPMIVLFCIIGVYAINLSTMDLTLMLGFGVLGYLMRKFGFDPAPSAWLSFWGRCWKSPCGSPCFCPRGVSRSFLPDLFLLSAWELPSSCC